jgi:hypothetical protein
MILIPERTHHKPSEERGMRNTNLRPKFRGLEILKQNQSLKKLFRTQSAVSQKNSEFCKYARYFNCLQECPE